MPDHPERDVLDDSVRVIRVPQAHGLYIQSGGMIALMAGGAGVSMTLSPDELRFAAQTMTQVADELEAAGDRAIEELTRVRDNGRGGDGE